MHGSLSQPLLSLSLYIYIFLSLARAHLYFRGGLVLHLRSSNDGVLRRLHIVYSTAPTNVLLRGQSDSNRNGSFKAANLCSRQPQV